MPTPSDSPSAREAPTLFAALATLARRAPDGALATAAATGLLGAAGLLFAPAGARLFLLPLIALGAFGFWGMVEREHTTQRADAEPRHGVPLANAAQWLAVAIGTAAAALGALAILGALFGTVIS